MNLTDPNLTVGFALIVFWNEIIQPYVVAHADKTDSVRISSGSNNNALVARMAG